MTLTNPICFALDVPSIEEAQDLVKETPEQAMREGASMIVVGRPIRDAADRVAAARDILASVKGNR